MSKTYGNEKETSKIIKTKMPLQRIIDLFIDLTDLRPIIFDVLEVFFGCEGW